MFVEIWFNQKDIKMEAKKPEWGQCGPIWWHHHGMKMRVLGLNLEGTLLWLQSSAAEVTISVTKGGWFVGWTLVQSQTEKISGKVFMDKKALRQAFGLENGDVPSHSRWLIDQYGGTVARQGQFIRFENFLNIPCPGTGHDGDPNVSIDLDDSIKAAVQNMVSTVRVG